MSAEGQDVDSARKRPRSPPGPPFTSDYRPYTGGQLRRVTEGRGGDDHRGHWDLYYRNNTVNGYKDRHYILREFVELHEAIAQARTLGRESAVAMALPGTSTTTTATTATTTSSCVTPPPLPGSGAGTFSWMEAGCGVGNAMLPIFEEHGDLPQWRSLLGFDISSVAVSLLEKKVQSLAPALASKVHVCALDPCERDVADCPFFERLSSPPVPPSSAPEQASASSPQPPPLPPLVPCCVANPVEFVSMIFVLCSIPVAKHALVLRRIAACMRRPGGCFFFRDYAAADHAEDRFQQRQRTARPSLGDGDDEAAAEGGTYARANGTLSHFFSLEEVHALMSSVGFTVVELKEVSREVHNRRTGAVLSRKFVQGRFRLD